MKNIWILNHYATENYFSEGGRHYWFAKYLKKKGYKVTIFCANTRHNSNDSIEMNSSKFVEKGINGIPFVFVKSTNYQKNNYKRILNILSFTIRMLKVAKEMEKKSGRPDIILASSVHPLTLIVGIHIAKKFKVPCISEIRDLWPESIVAYGILKEKNLLSQIMYKVEKWIYMKSNSIIMTWEGGYDYIKNKGWLSKINKSKIHHISNGVIIDNFNENSETYTVEDKDLNNISNKNFVYTGSIRKVNNLKLLVEASKIIQNRGFNNIKILIYGDGEERENLESLVNEYQLKNIVFKGRVAKKHIPFILKKSYATLLHNTSTKLDKYGQSQNKFFEYLAAGKPIIQTYYTGYSVVEKNNCGVCIQNQNPENIADSIIEIASNESQANIKGENSKKIARTYDFKKLTDKLIDIIEQY
ncbi:MULTISPECIES: glycosyltransferase family 4 protein [unclassified Staphylococcus]|uniref:glycosyltransferase family 4 protein n=1 Tax=unclassified Staphylococcus TaxID=91994 RepID=UPI001952105F|nr:MULTISPECIES: glycosyltransferase family 4 protein [unclassified Staphylococcus]